MRGLSRANLPNTDPWYLTQTSENICNRTQNRIKQLNPDTYLTQICEITRTGSIRSQPSASEVNFNHIRTESRTPKKKRKRTKKKKTSKSSSPPSPMRHWLVVPLNRTKFLIYIVHKWQDIDRRTKQPREGSLLRSDLP